MTSLRGWTGEAELVMGAGVGWRDVEADEEAEVGAGDERARCDMTDRVMGERKHALAMRGKQTMSWMRLRETSRWKEDAVRVYASRMWRVQTMSTSVEYLANTHPFRMYVSVIMDYI